MKKLSAIIICLLMLFTCSLAGCATFSIDKVKYYNEVLAKVGQEKITRYEVLNAYNSYGNSYFVQQQGQSEKKAIRSTLDLLVDREYLYQYAVNQGNTYKPTDRQVNEILEEMFDEIDSQMNQYLNKAKTLFGIKSDEVTSTEEESSTIYKYEDYLYTNNRAELIKEIKYYTDNSKQTISSTETDFYDEVYSIKYKVKGEEELDPIIPVVSNLDYTSDTFLNSVITKYFEEFRQNIINTEKVENVSKLYNKSVNLLVSDLINYEQYLLDAKGNAYNKKSEDLIYRYFERTFESKIESQYLENVRVKYLEETEELEISLLLDKLDNKITSSYAQYVNKQESYKTKMKSISTDGDTVFYHPTLNDGTEFGYFIHTLIKADEQTLNDIKLLDKNDADYDEDYASKISSIEVTKRNSNGEEDGTAKLTEIVEDYQKITNINNYQTKLAEFIQFMFTYTGDTATLSAGMPYVVGTNGYSSMVEAFTNESIKLMETGVKGAMSQVDINDLDTFCITEYGIHFIMYIAPVDEYDFAYEEKDMITESDLYKTLNPLTKETYFDMLFEEVYPASGEQEAYTSNTGYSSFESLILTDMKAETKPIYYTTKIKATKTSI